MNKLPITAGISDSEFIRGDVPITKEGVRVLSLSKLQLAEGDCILDIGAGTGSVSIEIARLLPESRVFAVEQNEKAIELIRMNASKFTTRNIEIIEGKAPEALQCIPKVNKVFVGGSGGNLVSILDWVKNSTSPGCRLVINAVTLNTLVTASDYLSNPAFDKTEIIQVSINHIEKVGNSDMFRPQSPVFIISATRV
jgi:precorrin-6Y C5,15-methyltransferase (decarboxylating) CbiT subunit